MSKKKIKVKTAAEEPIHLDIPEDEIWTYRVEGLAAPHINKPYKHYGLKKVIFALVIIVAVSISCYFSVRTVQKDTFEYKQTQTGYELSKFSNTGYITELDIDYVASIEYDRNNPDTSTNYKIIKDESKKVTSVRQYALNCDENVKTVKIGADVTYVDPKAFYSCWALRQIEVDENNPNYCDIDGVLEKFVVCDHISELVQVNKEILLAVDLAGSGLSCGRRDREADIVPALERLEHDGALTRSGRAGNYDQFSSLFSHFLFLPRLCLKFVPPKPPASTMIKSHVRCP